MATNKKTATKKRNVKAVDKQEALRDIALEHEVRIADLESARVPTPSEEEVADARRRTRRADDEDRDCDRSLRMSRQSHEQQVEYIEKRTVLNVNENVTNITDAVKCIAHANQALAQALGSLSSRHLNAFIDVSHTGQPVQNAVSSDEG